MSKQHKKAHRSHSAISGLTFRTLFWIWVLFAVLGKFQSAGSPLTTGEDLAGGGERCKIAILGFSNGTGTTNESHWAPLATCLLASEIGQSTNVQVMDATQCALSNLGVSVSASLNVTEARKVAAALGVQGLVWGTYHREGDKWHLDIKCFDCKAKAVPYQVEADSTNWFEICEKGARSILKSISPQDVSVQEWVPMAPWTKSVLALDAYARALKRAEAGGLLSASQQDALEAVQLDPRFSQAYVLLSDLLLQQSRVSDAERAISRAMELNRNLASAHTELGAILIFEKSFSNAEKELLRAIELDPNNFAPFELLGEMYAQAGDPARAIMSFKKALELDNLCANAHAHLAYEFASTADRAKALTELDMSEGLMGDHDFRAEQAIWSAYALLHEEGRAAAHCEKFISLARMRGINPEWLKPPEMELTGLQSRLTATSFTNTPPRHYDGATLARILEQRLKPAQITRVINPLEGSSQITHWARTLAKTGTNDLQKARMLFEPLNHRLQTAQVYAPRSAREVFEGWNNTGMSIQCEGDSFLYVALARAIGMQACIVDVRQTCDGQFGFHVCAAVFVNNACYLVDPMYHWFGVPHKEFVELDDLATMALYLAEQRDLECCAIAVQLAPAVPLVEWNYANGLMDSNRWAEARATLRVIESLDTDKWMSLFPRARLALHDGNADDALALLRLATTRAPLLGPAHLFLAGILLDKGRLDEARASLIAAQQCVLDQQQTEKARAAVAQLDVGRHVMWARP
jgi:tetratricopeptide (TPR) repeat protein